MRGALLVTTALILASSPASAEPFTLATLRPYLNNEINGLELNHLFLKSIFALNATPFTIGAGVRASPAKYLRTDDGTTDAGLGKAIYVLSWGFGRPATELAGFAGMNLSTVRPTGFPNLLAQSGDQTSFIPAIGVSAVFFAGMAYKGFAVELALHYFSQSYDADGIGRFVGGACPTDPGADCGGRAVRSGAPVTGPATHHKFEDFNWLLNFDHQSGYSLGILLSNTHPLQEDGTIGTKLSLGGFRALAQPEQLTFEVFGSLGIGLNSYDGTLDYYGDQIAAVNDAVARNAALPTPGGDIYEIPLLASNIADTGINARIVLQVLPDPLFRLAEVGYAIQASGGGLVPQAGARAKVFYRDSGFVPSVDAYAGLFWIFEKDSPDDGDRGISSYISYSYNSPDSLTFVPLPDSHVLGLQLVFGNPMALPPPVPIIRYPKMEDARPAPVAAEGGTP